MISSNRRAAESSSKIQYRYYKVSIALAVRAQVTPGQVGYQIWFLIRFVSQISDLTVLF